MRLGEQQEATGKEHVADSHHPAGSETMDHPPLQRTKKPTLHAHEGESTRQQRAIPTEFILQGQDVGREGMEQQTTVQGLHDITCRDDHPTVERAATCSQETIIFLPSD